MGIDDPIIAVTGCPYEDLWKTLPSDVDRESVVAAYEKIIDESLSDCQTQESPYLINVSGIPGAGKSTFCKKLMGKSEYADALYIGFDTIMENELLPYVNEEADNPAEAFRRWELPARIAGYELLKRAVARKHAIIFEHSAALAQHLSLFKVLQQKGYKIHFYHLSVKVEEAIRRVRSRKRHLPPGYIDQRHRILQELLPEYQKICTTFKQIESCEPELS